MWTIKRNLNCTNHDNGGAHEELINKIFIAHVQPPAFVTTQKALASAIPLFKEIVNMGGYNPVVQPAE